MIDLYESRQRVGEMKDELNALGESLDLDKMNERLDELNAQTEDVNFWNDQKQAQKVLKEQKILRRKISQYDEIKDDLDDLDVMIELADEGESVDELPKALDAYAKKFDDFKLETLLSGEYDSNNAIISLHPGAGGTESHDWASMLLRMYTRWAESKGYKVKTLDLQPGDVAGIKSATLLIEGINAYGYLKTERGVHRLVRISPFDASGRRHTSFASLDVTPQVDDSVDIEINPDDIRVDTYRSSGAGGQHVNKTDSAVRITHLPTGIVVTCQNERSQHANREQAMKILRARLADLYQQQQEAELNSLRGEQKDIAWGSQIRSYVFHPYSLVKDHRTGLEIGNIDAVMDGDLDALMESYLRRTAGKQE